MVTIEQAEQIIGRRIENVNFFIENITAGISRDLPAAEVEAELLKRLEEIRLEGESDLVGAAEFENSLKFEQLEF